MFKTMYSFWLNKFNSNVLNSKLNIWSIDNIRVFNLLSSSTLSFLIYSLNSPKLNYIKTIRSNLNFDYIVYYVSLIAIPLLLVTYIIIL